MDLKATLDAWESATVEAQEVAQEIEALFAESKTDEALALRDKFKAAEEKATSIKTLYDEMTAVYKSDAAKVFVPAGKETEQADEGPKTITRAEFDKLEKSEQAAFVIGGGQLSDEEGK